MNLIGQQRFIKSEKMGGAILFLFFFFVFRYTEEFACLLDVGQINKHATFNMQIPITLPQIERMDPQRENDTVKPSSLRITICQTFHSVNIQSTKLLHEKNIYILIIKCQALVVWRRFYCVIEPRCKLFNTPLLTGEY